jgi:hypothetical protein
LHFDLDVCAPQIQQTSPATSGCHRDILNSCFGKDKLKYMENKFDLYMLASVGKSSGTGCVTVLKTRT